MGRLTFALALACCIARAADPPGSALKDRWGRIGTADFEVYTNAGDTAARQAIEHLQQVRGFFLKASPLPLMDQFPVRIIVLKSPEQLKEYTRAEGRTAFFVSSPKRDYIVMSDAPNEYKYAIHEYMHLIVRHSGLRIPTWLNEGWADVYSTLRPVDGGVAVGDLIESRLHTLIVDKWLDLDTLTSIDPESPTYKGGGSQTEMFYSESWAMAHMLFLAPDYAGRFPKFLVAIHHGKNFEDACQAAYGKSGATVFADLKKYFERKKMYGKIFQAPMGQLPASLPVVKVEPFDARLLLADLLAAIGRRADARQEYAVLESLEPSRYEVPESLGYLAVAERNAPEALREFQLAFTTGDADPRMCLQLAILEQNARAPLAEPIQALERAVQSKPGYTDALLQLGLLRIAVRQYESGLALLNRIDKIGPEQATPVFSALAYGNFETGDLVKARKDAETAKQYARNADEVKRIDGMIGLIDARAKGPFAPQPGEKTVRLEGELRQVECSPNGNRIALSAGDRTMFFELPDPRGVEFVHLARGPMEMQTGQTLQLSCGPQKPMRITLEYAPASLEFAPASVVERPSAGVIRRLEY